MSLFADFRVVVVESRALYLVVRNLFGSEAIGCLQYKFFTSQAETNKMDQ